MFKEKQHPVQVAINLFSDYQPVMPEDRVVKEDFINLLKEVPSEIKNNIRKAYTDGFNKRYGNPYGEQKVLSNSDIEKYIKESHPFIAQFDDTPQKGSSIRKIIDLYNKIDTVDPDFKNLEYSLRFRIHDILYEMHFSIESAYSAGRDFLTGEPEDYEEASKYCMDNFPHLYLY